MSETEIRIACIDLALRTNLQRESEIPRAIKFAEWVEGDVYRLKALEAACKKQGSIAKMPTDQLLDLADKYITWACVTPPKPKRGRPKKT